ncbi:MAG: Asp23/Gls24 family envelope stress response protein [Ruminococcaceae bacterium]|nr:Asp23/Gls24 family envelope stress response protein [Oscillospiraceae bacterium]
MAETKEYITQVDELGNIHISEEVLAVIAAAAALEVEGVSSLASAGKDLADLWGKKNLARGIHVQVENEQVQVELTIMVKYGYTILDVARAVQDAVFTNIESMSSLKVQSVNINVGGVSFEKEAAKQAQ